MNVYDFDGTLYNGDSSVDFYIFALKKQPALVRYLPGQFWGFLRYALGRTGKREWKGAFFSFLQGIDGTALAEEFWERRQDRVVDWYESLRQPGDLVISASPSFLLGPICQRIGIRRLIATEMDPATGALLGENCRGEEKVRRLRAQYGAEPVECFYSDSQVDLPLARLAHRAFLVKKGHICPWVLPPEKKAVE